MAPLPCLASSCATSTSTAATPALMDGKNDGLSFENGNTQSACSAMGETLLSVRAITFCAAALAVQKVIAGQGLLANVLERGEQLRAGLREAFADHPNVGDVRGRGLFVGVEFVADRQTKAPLAPQQRMHAQLKTAAMRNGLLVYPMGGTIDGVRGDHALIAPPFVTTASQIDAIVDRFAASVQAVLPRVGQTFAQEA